MIGWGANKLFEMLDDEQNDPDFRGAVVAASFVEIFDETLIDLVPIDLPSLNLNDECGAREHCRRWREAEGACENEGGPLTWRCLIMCICVWVCAAEPGGQGAAPYDGPTRWIPGHAARQGENHSALSFSFFTYCCSLMRLYM